MKNYRDDFKVRFTKEPQYTIDEVNKTVKCYLTCDVIVPTSLSGGQLMYNFRTFAKGYAKCDDNDKFNPEIGKRIALARAESKLYWKVRTEVKLAIRDAKQFIKAGEKFICKTHRVMKHNEKYIENYVKPQIVPEFDKEMIKRAFSEKAKSQPRDGMGRFTACTDYNKTACTDYNKTKDCDKARDIKNVQMTEKTKDAPVKENSIRIHINRK